MALPLWAARFAARAGGHPSLFHTAIFHLNWYKMACMANILYRVIWEKCMSMLSMYVQSGMHRHFHWKVIAVLTQNPTVLMFVDVTGASMGICCGFRTVAAGGNYPGFMLFHKTLSLWQGEPVNYKETNGLPTSPCHGDNLWSSIIMVVADGLQPIWRQVICNHHDDVNWSVRP